MFSVIVCLWRVRKAGFEAAAEKGLIKIRFIPRMRHSPCLFISLSTTFLQPQSADLSLSTHTPTPTHTVLNFILSSCQHWSLPCIFKQSLSMCTQSSLIFKCSCTCLYILYMLSLRKYCSVTSYKAECECEISKVPCCLWMSIFLPSVPQEGQRYILEHKNHQGFLFSFIGLQILVITRTFSCSYTSVKTCGGKSQLREEPVSPGRIWETGSVSAGSTCSCDCLYRLTLMCTCSSILHVSVHQSLLLDTLADQCCIYRHILYSYIHSCGFAVLPHHLCWIVGGWALLLLLIWQMQISCCVRKKNNKKKKHADGPVLIIQAQ